jgi:ribosome-binding ATPase YchF (GTP1/OBG family)
VVLSGQIEAEIGALPEDERQAFMEDLGLTETGIDRLARAAYEHMGLISFLTVGEDEVRAWTISQGTPARAAAGKIHTDLERCFVRAEVIGYETFMTYRSLQEARAHGQIRSVGKEEIIRDGDIVNILANA